MPASTVSIIYEFGAAALFGAWTKTYFDYKDKNERLKGVLIAFLSNSIFAGLIASHVADLFVKQLPEWSSFGLAVAYISGALCLNIMWGLLSIKWGDVIKARLIK